MYIYIYMCKTYMPKIMHIMHASFPTNQRKGGLDELIESSVDYARNNRRLTK